MRAREKRDHFGQVAMVPVDRLRAHPRNVRHDLGDLRELADSIAADGVLVPVMAERRGETLRLLHGHRRTAAAKLAGLRRVPCVVVPEHTEDDAIALMLAENTARAGLTRDEKRDAVDALHGHGWTLEQIAGRLGVSVSTVSTWRRSDQPDDDPVEEQSPRAVIDEHAIEALIAGRKAAAEVSLGERREAVARLTRQGWSREAIADRLKLDERQVSRDRQVKGLAANAHPNVRRPASVSAKKVGALLEQWEGRAPRALLDALAELVAGTTGEPQQGREAS